MKVKNIEKVKKQDKKKTKRCLSESGPLQETIKNHPNCYDFIGSSFYIFFNTKQKKIVKAPDFGKFWVFVFIFLEKNVGIAWSGALQILV